MVKTISFGHPAPLCWWLGRNGQFKQTGLSVADTGFDTVILEPVTTKGLIGRASLEVPKSEIPALIEALKQIAQS